MRFALLAVAAALFGCALWNAKPACEPWPQCGCDDPKHGVGCPDDYIGPVDRDSFATKRDAGSDG